MLDRGCAVGRDLLLATGPGERKGRKREREWGANGGFNRRVGSVTFKHVLGCCPSLRKGEAKTR